MSGLVAHQKYVTITKTTLSRTETGPAGNRALGDRTDVQLDPGTGGPKDEIREFTLHDGTTMRTPGDTEIDRKEVLPTSPANKRDPTKRIASFQITGTVAVYAASSAEETTRKQGYGAVVHDGTTLNATKAAEGGNSKPKGTAVADKYVGGYSYVYKWEKPDAGRPATSSLKIGGPSWTSKNSFGSPGSAAPPNPTSEQIQSSIFPPKH